MKYYTTLQTVALLALTTALSPAFAQQPLPYNPTRILTAQNGSVAYIFSPASSSSTQFSLSLLNTSERSNRTSTTTTLSSILPFLSSVRSRAFTPIADDKGITVLAGDCSSTSNKLELWRYDITNPEPSWSQLQTASGDSTLSANFLAAGFSFSVASSTDDATLYVFGGMCPKSNVETTATWITDATYSNMMLSIVRKPGTTSDSPYQLSVTGARAPPIPEAGLTITPLLSTSSKSVGSSGSHQQNFVLLGGHTQNAFINMSQAAMFSLPEQSWSFVNIQNPTGVGSTELMARDGMATAEPRSGHTAVITDDGTKIIVLGGWVGDTLTAAEPQLMILQVGSGYGGTGNWAWKIPPQTGPVANGASLYGHGATILPGGVMMVAGGYKMSAPGSKLKRDTTDVLFFNTTSLTWIDSYINPSSSSLTSQNSAIDRSGLSSSQKAGLGVGITLGVLAITGIVIFWILYRKKLRQKRSIREKELRAQALGTERYNSPSLIGDDHRFPGRRSSSWGMQEKHIGNVGNAFPWAPIVSPGEAGQIGLEKEDVDRRDEKSGLLPEIPSPGKVLRRSLNSRSHTSYDPAAGPGSVFRIDEEDETSNAGSLRRAKSPLASSGRDSTLSDPFKDPPILAPTLANTPAELRRKEVAGWVDDWTQAAESMNLSRQPSQAHSRTYSNLSQANSHSHSGGSQSGRGSPDKSDRTGSNLSERSILSAGFNTMSRNTSQRSASAGYALFANASAAMGKLTGARMGHTNQSEVPPTLARSPSIRSVSLNIDSTANRVKTRERGDTFSSVRTSLGPFGITEEQTYLSRANSRAVRDDNDYWTPPESPIKEKYPRTSSLTSTGRKALGLLGSMRRVFTGTGSVDVQDRVATLEGRSGSSSPTKHITVPEIPDWAPRRTSSAGAAFLRNQQGAKDWNADTSAVCNSMTSTTTRRKRPSDQFPNLMDDGSFIPISTTNNGGQPSSTDHHVDTLTDDEDWDIETAVQRRVVQVMFTVPKERLRVVNADALSLLSSNRSEVDAEDDKEREKETQIKRMSSVREHDDEGILEFGAGLDLHTNPDKSTREANQKGKERDILGPVGSR